MSQSTEISVVRKEEGIRRLFKKTLFFKNESGATAVEYSLLVGLIAVFLIAAITTLGSSISETFREAACKVAGNSWADGTGGNPGICTKV